MQRFYNEYEHNGELYLEGNVHETRASAEEEFEHRSGYQRTIHCKPDGTWEKIIFRPEEGWQGHHPGCRGDKCYC